MARSVPIRIEPQFVTSPMFYGSPGEPSMLTMPSVLGPSRPIQFAYGGFSPLLMGPLALGLMGYSQSLDREAADRSSSGTIRQARDQMPDEFAFGMAFALARRMDLKEFSWRGKRYTTKLKPE